VDSICSIRNPPSIPCSSFWKTWSPGDALSREDFPRLQSSVLFLWLLVGPDFTQDTNFKDIEWFTFQKEVVGYIQRYLPGLTRSPYHCWFGFWICLSDIMWPIKPHASGCSKVSSTVRMFFGTSSLGWAPPKSIYFGGTTSAHDQRNWFPCWTFRQRWGQ
jgi:hypothetical protein